MNCNLISLPPPPSAPVLEVAFGLLAVAADPAGCKARLDELIKATEEICAAHAEMEAERQRLDNRLQAVEDLRKRENAVALAAEENQKISVQLANARAAQQDRESKLQADAAALQQKIKEHEAAVAAHVRRVEQAKAALG